MVSGIQVQMEHHKMDVTLHEWDMPQASTRPSAYMQKGSSQTHRLLTHPCPFCLSRWPWAARFRFRIFRDFGTFCGKVATPCCRSLLPLEPRAKVAMLEPRREVTTPFQQVWATATWACLVLFLWNERPVPAG